MGFSGADLGGFAELRISFKFYFMFTHPYTFVSGFAKCGFTRQDN